MSTLTRGLLSRCESILSRSATDALNVIEGYDLITFDVFDTLIYRRCGFPDSVFDIVGARMGVPHYRDIRRQIRKKAESQSSEQVTLAEIYGVYGASNQPFAEIAIELMEQEVRVEIEECTAIKSAWELFEAAIESGHRVALVSDMYLPDWLIRTMLMKAGYNLHGVSTYVSCERGCSKKDGGLFDIVLNEERVSDPSKALHIGDSLLQDYLMPKRRGMDALLLRRPQ